MVFFAFSGVEAGEGPGSKRLKLGGEMQARTGGLQPWIMPRKTTRLIPLLERCLHVTCGLLPFDENLPFGVRPWTKICLRGSSQTLFTACCQDFERGSGAESGAR